MNRQQQVWRLLRKNGAMSPRAVADAIGISRNHAGQQLRRLCDRGCAVGIGSTHRRRFEAIGNYPADMRGHHPQVEINLAKGRTLGNIARAKRRGRLHVPKARHALDQTLRAWR